MSASGSPRIAAYAGLAAIFLLAGLALERAEVVALAAPFALVAAVALGGVREPKLELRLGVDRERVTEGDEVTATIHLFSSTGVDRLDVALVLPDGLELAEGGRPRALRLRPGEERELELTVRCAQWGGYQVGEAVVRARDALGLRAWEGRFRDLATLRVYPRVDELRALLPPLETQVYVGNQVSGAKGEGIEFADIRPFTAGDRVRSINWRASSRRGVLQVNERNPERNTDVVLFLDTFSEVRGDAGGTIDSAVRAAASLSARYLGRKDRVGVVGFGGLVSWLLPATGLTQLYRIVDALIMTDVVLSFAQQEIEHLPPRSLPPKALVIALTPLLDVRSTTALLDLRARGFDLVVVELSPVPYVAPGKRSSERLAHRLWVLRREVLRERYEELGVPVVEWRPGLPLDAALEEVTAYRRFARPVRA